MSHWGELPRIHRWAGASAIATAVLFATGNAAAMRASDGELTEPLALALFDISYVLGYNAAGIGIGLLALAAGAVALRSGALLPRWLAVVLIGVGAALLTPLSQYVLGPAFLLLLVLGVLVLRGSALPATAVRK